MGYSFAGIDIRYALEIDEELRSLVKTLVTINSPHGGSLLSSLVSRGKVSLPLLDQVMNVLGIEQNAFREFNEDNMEDFNTYLEESEMKRVGFELLIG